MNVDGWMVGWMIGIDGEMDECGWNEHINDMDGWIE